MPQLSQCIPVSDCDFGTNPPAVSAKALQTSEVKLVNNTRIPSLKGTWHFFFVKIQIDTETSQDQSLIHYIWTERQHFLLGQTDWQRNRPNLSHKNHQKYVSVTSSEAVNRPPVFSSVAAQKLCQPNLRKSWSASLTSEPRTNTSGLADSFSKKCLGDKPNKEPCGSHQNSYYS